MKRKPRADPRESPRKIYPRQDPVSCESCRRKKLKCDRQHPCASCVTRRLECHYNRGSVTTHALGLREEEISTRSVPPMGIDIVDKEAPDARVLLPAASYQHKSTATQNTRESLKTADWLEHIHMGDRIPAALSPQVRAEMEEPRDEDPVLGSDVETSPPHILFATLRTGWMPTENPATINLVACLPEQSNVLELFQYYCRYIDYLYHLIIPEHVERQIHGVYECVERGAPVNLSHMAVLFAITGASLYVQLSITSSRQAELCIRQFSFLTGAALIQANHTTYPTVEGLQASLIILHNVSNIHCDPCVSPLFVNGSVISQAKNLMLHCVDTPQSVEERKKSHAVNWAHLELKRRLWWDIASFDWFLSFLSGPQEGTYLVSPEFIYTKKPLNIDDCAIGNIPPTPTSPTADADPTVMTFFLERVKFSEVCRSVVDTISRENFLGTEIDYSTILDLDRKIHQAQSEIPPFFRLDLASRRQYASLYRKRPTLAWQRCLLQQAYYSRLCRLHRTYFIRGARDPAYSYSHIICLQSARKVIEIKRIMDEEEPQMIPSSSAVWSIMHHVFMAAVMLLLDVCYNWDDILAEKRKEEVLDVCRMLSKAQQSSSLVKEGITAMMGILQNHYRNARQPMNPEEPVPAIYETTSSGEKGLTSITTNPGSLLISGGHGNRDGGEDTRDSVVNLADHNSAHVKNDTRLEDVWGEILDSGGNMDLESEDWINLFTELTNAPIPTH